MASAKTTTPPTAAAATTSAAAAAEAAAAATDSKARILLQPVPVVDSPLAKGLSFARVAVLLSLLAWRMDSLIADPVSTLWVSLPVVAAVQVGYVAVCLPPAGSPPPPPPHHGKAGKKPRPGEKKKSDGSGGAVGVNHISSAIIALILAMLTVPAVYAFFVLFGAPFLDGVWHTALCAAHFSLLAVFPVVYARGLDRRALVAVAGSAAPLDETFGGLAGAVAGAWLGAVPIPLDWDRAWQRWPVTIVVGVYLGAAAGSLLAGTVLYGKRMGGTPS